MKARKKPVTGKARTATKPAKAAKAAPSKAKAAAKPAAAPKVVATLSSKPIAQKQSKAQIYAEIAELTTLSKNDVKNVIQAIKSLIARHVKPKGSGEFTLHDVGIRVRRIQKKATKARMGRNPFTGQEIEIPAKPARKSVKVSALKSLKTLIEE